MDHQVEADLALAGSDGADNRRVQALQLVLFNLSKLQGHMSSSRRVLNDLRNSRRLLLRERTLNGEYSQVVNRHVHAVVNGEFVDPPEMVTMRRRIPDHRLPQPFGPASGERLPTNQPGNGITPDRILRLMANADHSVVEFASEFNNGLQVTAHVVCAVRIARNANMQNTRYNRIFCILEGENPPHFRCHGLSRRQRFHQPGHLLFLFLDGLDQFELRPGGDRDCVPRDAP